MSWFDENTYTPPEAGGVTGGLPGLTGISGPESLQPGTTDSTFGSLLTPFTGTYKAPTTPNYQTFSPSSFSGPAAYVKPPDFENPTASSMTIDPSYQFRLQQGQQALENNNAARGLNTGATAKGLIDYGQGAASQEYQNIYNRALQNYQTNTQLGMATQNQAFNQALQPWQQANALGLNATQANNAALTQGFQNAEQNALNAYNTAYQTNAYNQQTPYNMLMGVAGLGANTANQAANLGSTYAGNYANILGQNANTIGNLYGQQGNATASGTVGGANAWNSALGGLGNAAQGYSLYNLLLGNNQQQNS